MYGCWLAEKEHDQQKIFAAHTDTCHSHPPPPPFSFSGSVELTQLKLSCKIMHARDIQESCSNLALMHGKCPFSCKILANLALFLQAPARFMQDLAHARKVEVKCPFFLHRSCKTVLEAELQHYYDCYMIIHAYTSSSC